MQDKFIYLYFYPGQLAARRIWYLYEWTIKNEVLISVFEGVLVLLENVSQLFHNCPFISMGLEHGRLAIICGC